MSRRTDSRETILQAAEKVVAEDGAAHLTLDAVAAKAKLSKGGLLYHFPTKEALVQGMLTRLLERADEDQAKFQAEIGDRASADLRACVMAGLQSRPDDRRVSAALLAAGANDPRLLDPAREWQKKHYQKLARTKRNAARAMVILLAMDGLWLNELLQTSPLTSADRTAVIEELMRLADSAAQRS